MYPRSRCGLPVSLQLASVRSPTVGYRGRRAHQRGLTCHSMQDDAIHGYQRHGLGGAESGEVGAVEDEGALLSSESLSGSAWEDAAQTPGSHDSHDIFIAHCCRPERSIHFTSITTTTGTNDRRAGIGRATTHQIVPSAAE